MLTCSVSGGKEERGNKKRKRLKSDEKVHFRPIRETRVQIRKPPRRIGRMQIGRTYVLYKPRTHSQKKMESAYLLSERDGRHETNAKTWNSCTLHHLPLKGFLIASKVKFLRLVVLYLIYGMVTKCH